MAVPRSQFAPSSQSAPVEGAGSGPVPLVQRARRGDAAAFRALFERYAPPVGRFLRDLFRDGPAADEATQETFVRAHARLATLDDSSRLGSWLFGIARNVYFEHRRARAGNLYPGDAGDDDGLAALRAVLPTPNPEAILLGRELAGHLDEALAKLRPARRAALLLRVDHGLGYDDIAQAMGWTLPQVKNELHRARLELRVSLAGHLGDGE